MVHLQLWSFTGRSAVRRISAHGSDTGHNRFWWCKRAIPWGKHGTGAHGRWRGLSYLPCRLARQILRFSLDAAAVRIQLDAMAPAARTSERKM